MDLLIYNPLYVYEPIYTPLGGVYEFIYSPLCGGAEKVGLKVSAVFWYGELRKLRGEFWRISTVFGHKKKKKKIFDYKNPDTPPSRVYINP